MAKRIHRQEGFTLIELMIVILIIGILVGIAVPVFLAAQNNAKAKSCQANQRNFLGAADIYAADTQSYPLAVGDATDDGAVWPADFYEGALDGNSGPECPSDDTAGTVAVTYGGGVADSEIRPTTVCGYAANHNVQ